MKAMDTECVKCGGTGWRTVPASAAAVAEGKKKSPQVTRCDCRVDAKTERLLANARIPKRYEHCSLESFHTEFEGRHESSLAKARLTAGRFVEEYPVKSTGLLLIGPVGVGKTHLAVGIVRELVQQKGIGCLFYDYRELLKEIQNSYNPSVSTTELSILRPVFEAEVLVLDELGAVKPTEWVWDTVSHILNTRYNDKRTTIITTNYPDAPEVMEADAVRRAARELTLGDRIGDRMLSRLHEMCKFVKVDGSDFRQRVQSASFR
jgi:DNA replication protein DnaC